MNNSFLYPPCISFLSPSLPPSSPPSSFPFFPFARVFIPSCPTLFSHSLIPLVSTFSFRYFTQVRPLDIGYLTTEHAQVMKTSCPMVMSKTSSIIFGKGGSRSKSCLFNYIHKRGENLLWDFTSLYLVCTTG